MASFLVFAAREAGVSKHRLESEFAARGIACGTPYTHMIEFAGSSDTLYLHFDGDSVRRAELNPDPRARPAVYDRIFDVLDDLGYEHLDDDDPRIADE